MDGKGLSRIWKPSVELVDPSDVGPGEQPACLSQSARYTKTSLRHSGAMSNDGLQQLNARIREANESHNTTARPFAKQTSLVSPPLYQEPASFKLVQSVGSSQSAQPQSSNQSDQPVGNLERDGAMSPNLLHRQYNSPLDLYSMKNIHETIEAHSEVLASGVKGINFMKDENPINKESEVYKLIKEEEEEEERRRRNPQHETSSGPVETFALARRSSPAARGPPNVMLGEQQRQNSTLQWLQQERNVNRPIEANLSSPDTNDRPKIGRSLAETLQESLPMSKNLLKAKGNGNADKSAHMTSGEPKCCECDKLIVGPFAKIEDRFVHQHCFNCSTCGGSLKNSGYFTINQRLYCDIHAPQVANAMRLNNNFEPNKQAVDNTRQQYKNAKVPPLPLPQSPLQPRLQQQQVIHKHQATLDPSKLQDQLQDRDHQQATGHLVRSVVAKSNELLERQGSESQPGCSNCRVTLDNRSATISTMFSKRVGTGCACPPRSEIQCIWRPCHNHSAIDQRQKEVVSIRSPTPTPTSGSQQHNLKLQALKDNYEARLAITPATSAPNDRLPVCCNCHTKINGPYILQDGTKVWCKTCIVANFVCRTCRKSLLNVGFIEGQPVPNAYSCEQCFAIYLAPVCAKCHMRIKDETFYKALGKTWHSRCFLCAHCKCQFENSSFYLEDNLPYCERDWNLLFTKKCYSCNYPIEACNKWVEALNRSYHSDCFRCAACQVKLEGTTFHCKAGKPYCRMHAS